MGSGTGEAAHGVWRAVVVEGADPEKAGRVRVVVPSVSARAESWARLAIWYHPQAGDEVLVAFEAGDLSSPVVLGALWSSSESPPGASRDEEESARRPPLREGGRGPVRG